MYYKAYISLATEQMDDEGCIPETYQDFGVVETIQAPTLQELKEKISKQFFNLEKPIGADVQIFDSAIEISCEDDSKPQINNYRITISKVEETYIDLSNEGLFKGVAR